MDDNTTPGIIHKISATTGRMTVYVGSLINTSKGPCPTNTTSQGDNCPQPTTGQPTTFNNLYTDKDNPSPRPRHRLQRRHSSYADYTGNYDHKVSAATGILSVVTGTGMAQCRAPAHPGGRRRWRGPGQQFAWHRRRCQRQRLHRGHRRRTCSALSALWRRYAPRHLPPRRRRYIQHHPVQLHHHQYKNQSDNGVAAASAFLNAPEDVQVDTNGNVYIADAGNNVVRALYNGQGSLPGITNPVVGTVYLIAGYSSGVTPAQNTYPTDGTSPTFPATTVAITDRKISLDSRNNLYIADSSANVVWFVDNVTGNIRLLAGSLGLTAGAAAPCTAITGNTVGDGCQATHASLYSVSDMGVSTDNQGNIYLTDARGGVAASALLRKVVSGLNFPALASGASATQTILIHFGLNDTQAAANAFTITGSGTANVDFTAGAPTCIVETDLTSDCTVPITFKPTRPGYDTATLTITSALGGVNSYLLTGTGNASAIAIDPGSVTLAISSVKAPQGIAQDGAGNVYTADTGNNRVLITTPAGVTTTFAGTGAPGKTGDGGLATLATLNAPKGVAVDTSGSVYITDTGNNTIRKVTADGKINTIGGGATTVCGTALNSRGDGCPATAATFSAPWGIAADNLGVLYIADSGNNVIRQITTSGFVSTLAGGATAVCATAVDVFGDGCSA